MQVNRRTLAGVTVVALVAMLLGWLVVRERGAGEEAVRAEGRSAPRDTERLRGEDRDASPAGIRGVVRDEDGRAIAGARVCAWQLDDAERVAAPLAARCATAEDDGRYELRPSPGRLRVVATAAGHLPASWRDDRTTEREWLTLGVGQLRDDVDLTLARGGLRLAGRVEDVAGGTIEGALLIARDGSPSATAVSDADGAFELWVAPGEHLLDGAALGYAPTRLQVQAPHEQIVLQLTPESVVVGRVVDARTGIGLEGVEVSATPGPHRHPIVDSEADGQFRIAGLRPGRYQLEARGEGVYGLGTELALGLGQTSEPIELRVHPAYHVVAELRVRELDGRERACLEGGVRLRGSGLVREAPIDGAGRARLDAVPPGRYQLRPWCADMLEHPEVAIALGRESSGDEPRQFWFEPGYFVSGRVVDDAGRGVAGVWVHTEGSGRGSAIERSADEGRFELGPLGPGSYVVWPRIAEPVQVEVELRDADVDDVELVAGGFGSIRGLVRDPEGRGLARRRLDVRGPRARQVGIPMTDGDGRFELDALAAGTYVVAQMGDNRPGARGSDFVGQTVEVRAGEVAQVELVGEPLARGTIAGTVTEDGGPAIDAWVVAGRGPAAALERDHEIGPVLCEQDGSFELRGLGDGSWAVRAWRPDGGEAGVEGVALGSDVELELGPRAGVAGIVRRADGDTPDRFELRVAQDRGGPGRELQFYRTAGRFELDGLSPGAWSIEVAAPGGHAALKLELGAGERREDLELELDAHVTIVGRTIDAGTREPVSSIQIRVDGSGRGYHPDAIPGPDGRFELSGVPVGDAQLWLMPVSWGAGRYGMSSYTLRTAAEPPVQDVGEIAVFGRRVARSEPTGDLGFETRLRRPKPGRPIDETRLEVASVVRGGPAARAGLEVGDAIVAIDGVAVTGAAATRCGAFLVVGVGVEVELELEGGGRVTIVSG